MILTVALEVILGTVLAYFLAKFLRIIYLLSKFPGASPIEILTSFFSKAHIITSKDLSKYRKTNRGLLVKWKGPFPILFVYGAEHVEVMLTKYQNDTTKGMVYQLVKPWLRTGLLTSEGEKWFQRRKLLAPTFHFSILQTSMCMLNKHSLTLVEKMKKFAKREEPVNIFPAVTNCTLDIICGMAMGRNINAQNDSENEYVKAVDRMYKLVIGRTFNPLLWPDAIFYRTKMGKEHNEALQVLHCFTKRVIQERMKESDAPINLIDDSEDDIAPGRKTTSFLDLLIKLHREDPNFTLEDIQEEVDTFMFAGHDTSALPASWAIYFLGLNSDIQAKVHEELDQLFGNSDRPVTSDDLPELPYLTRVIKETLRIMPPAPASQRKPKRDITLAGKVVPKETEILLNIYQLHRDPEYFPDPERFNPDRFLPENVEKRHAFAYIPFLAGPRNCIGQKFAMMEEKVLLANFLRNFSIKAEQPAGECLCPLLIIKPKNGELFVKLNSRQ